MAGEIQERSIADFLGDKLKWAILINVLKVAKKILETVVGYLSDENTKQMIIELIKGFGGDAEIYYAVMKGLINGLEFVEFLIKAINGLDPGMPEVRANASLLTIFKANMEEINTATKEELEEELATLRQSLLN